MTTTATIGDEVRAARITAGLSQEALARQIDCSLGTIRNIETGRTEPSWRVFRALDLALGLSASAKGRYDSPTVIYLT